MSIDLDDEINRILRHKQGNRHSLFQLQYFLIGKQPTIQSKLWRCVTELKNRKDTLDSLKLEIEDVNDTVKLIDIKIQEVSTADAALQDEKTKIKIRRLNRKKTEYIKRIESLEDRESGVFEEIAFIVHAFKSLEKLEEIKAYDDIECQKEYWNEMLMQDFNLRDIFNLPQDMETLKTILALNKESGIKQDLVNRIETIKAIKAQFKKRQIEEYDAILEAARNSPNLEDNQKGQKVKHGI